MSFIRFVLGVSLLICLAGGMVSCGGGTSTNPPAPLTQFQPEIVNNPDSFSFQATGIENVNTTVSYTWPNSGTQATIDHSSVITAGSATVSIYDTNDSLVYTNGLVASANESSTVGLTGDWRIAVTITSCTGTLNFRVQKL